MDLTTDYLGLRLAHPFVAGASPLTGDLDTAVQLEDFGAAAIVLPSLFEEDIVRYEETTDRYLQNVVRLKRRVACPVIASLNGTTPDRWLRYARLLEHAGADALELNFYHVVTDPIEDGRLVEQRVVDIVAVLKESIAIPLAVKLSPMYSSLPHLAAELDRIGANGLVLFNRFYEPDIDLEARRPTMSLTLSDSSELPLRLRWIAILAGRVRASLAVSGGVHNAGDALKAIMAGADCVQLVSALLRMGPRALRTIRLDTTRWLAEHGVESVREIKGSVSAQKSADPAAFERGNYVRLLQSSQKSGALVGK
jgi:dihydroorotate dehydrogenase (fumarate)